MSLPILGWDIGGVNPKVAWLLWDSMAARR
jgi:hypothetical protein